MAKFCFKCGTTLRERSQFCHKCGTRSRSSNLEEPTPSPVRTELPLIADEKPSWIDRMKKKIQETRKDTTDRIDNYLANLEDREKISGIKLTDGRRNFLRTRLLSMRERIAEGEDDETVQQELQALSVALETLPADLENEKCVVCMKPVVGDIDRKLSFCPQCLRGGHQEHLAEWIKIKGTCPVCRQELTPVDLVTYQAPVQTQ